MGCEAQPYTGCNPRASHSHTTKLLRKDLSFHHIPVPGFGVFPMNQKVVRPLLFPPLVKSVIEEGSVGFASVVHDNEAGGRVELSIGHSAAMRSQNSTLRAGKSTSV
jgi:hypothetical protein